MSDLYKITAADRKKIEELFNIYGKFIEELRGFITYKNHKMMKDTLEKFKRLEAELEKQGYKPIITSTTTGKHKDPAHKNGDAVDFIVHKNGKPISKEDSISIEKTCKEMRWKVFNEYIKNSEYKTGDHIHITNAR